MSFALFAAALEKLGFRFTAVSGRVQLGADSTHPRPATRAMLIVGLDGARWLSDVGFGHSPLELIELVDGGRSEAGPWPYLLRWQDITHGSPGWAVHQRGGETDDPDGWVVRQVFTETPQYPVDYAVGNHFVATHDRSPTRSATTSWPRMTAPRSSPARTSSGRASTGTTRSTRWSGRRNARAGTG
ncbi:arylamine N-acetyltransferase family protein [Streptomyces griseoincarnatus]